MDYVMSKSERQDKEKELIDILLNLNVSLEEATIKAQSLSDSELISEITDCGMCVGWE